MKQTKLGNPHTGISHAINLALAATVLLVVAPAATYRAGAGTDNRAPEVPPALEVPDGNKVSFQTYAAGVQIYAATPSSMSPTGFVWAFQAPEAVLFDADGSIVGIHYAGPTWETESGSKVVGVVSARATVTPGAIQWLLLDAASTDGPGVFERTTHIHRVNTEGGLAPAALPTAAGEEARVPYTAEYFFYRAE